MNTEQTYTAAVQRTTLRRLKWWLMGVALIALATLFSHSDARGFPVTGVVIDGDANKPIPYAWVTQEWRSKTTWGIPFVVDGNSTRSMCDAYQLTQADENGRFRFEKPENELRDIGLNRWYAVHTAILLGYGHESSPEGEEAVVESAWRKTSGAVRVVMRRQGWWTRTKLVREANIHLSGRLSCGNLWIEKPNVMMQSIVVQVRSYGITLDELTRDQQAFYEENKSLFGGRYKADNAESVQNFRRLNGVTESK